MHLKLVFENDDHLSNVSVEKEKTNMDLGLEGEMINPNDMNKQNLKEQEHKKSKDDECINTSEDIERKESDESQDTRRKSDQSMEKQINEVKKLKRKGSQNINIKTEDEPAFVGIKLKKASRVNRTWEEDKLETVDLKHHEFEKKTMNEVEENLALVALSNPKENNAGELIENVKKKKNAKSKKLLEKSDLTDEEKCDKEEFKPDKLEDEEKRNKGNSETTIKKEKKTLI